MNWACGLAMARCCYLCCTTEATSGTGMDMAAEEEEMATGKCVHTVGPAWCMHSPCVHTSRQSHYRATYVAS